MVQLRRRVADRWTRAHEARRGQHARDRGAPDHRSGAEGLAARVRGPWIVGPLGEAGLRIWAWERLGPAARELAGRDDVTTHTLRHTHASALHYAGWTVPEAARRMGHGPALHAQTYAHVIDAVQGRRYPDLDALLEAARAELECRESAADSS